MPIDTETFIKEPIGRIMASIGRKFLSGLQHNLAHLDIDRSFYPLLLIAGAKGNLSQQELAVMLSCDKVQIVRIVDYLSSKGCVKRIRDKNDKRKSLLEITPKAKSYIPDINKAIEETTSKAFENLTDKEITELLKSLSLIEKNLSR